MEPIQPAQPTTPPQVAGFLERTFKLRENRTTFFREMMGGAVTFMTMAYIILVNPQILTNESLVAAKNAPDFSGVMLATCIAAGVATLMMAFVANYPIALAPGMGLNAYFAYEICLKNGVRWQLALGMVIIGSILFLLISFTALRVVIARAVPNAVKYGAAVGIGFFIAFIGLQGAKIIVGAPTLVSLGSVHVKETQVALVGIGFIMILMALRVPGAILIGIVGTVVVAYFTKQLQFDIKGFSDVVCLPNFKKLPGVKMEFIEIFKNIAIYWPFILVLLYFDMFDTLGTMMGVGEAGGFMVDGQLPRAKQVMIVDATGSVVGGFLGTSTVTSYIESVAGISSGARTGLANIPTALLFFAFMFFTPLAKYVALPFITAPALVVVGSFMMTAITKIDWRDFTEAFPAFLTIIVMPLTFSISHGLAAGFVSYAVVKIFSGRVRGTHWLTYILAAVFAAYFVFVTK
jgi:AGZA family xanthine/uracil permease-like MFS transporter